MSEDRWYNKPVRAVLKRLKRAMGNMGYIVSINPEYKFSKQVGYFAQGSNVRIWVLMLAKGLRKSKPPLI